MEAVTYRGNSNARRLGGALILRDVTQVKLEKCSFSTNSAAHAGALLISGSQSVTVSACSFIENAAEGSFSAGLLPLTVGEGMSAPPRAGGAALFMDITSVEVRNSSFLDNRVRRNGRPSLSYSFCED